jgi:hypothetical protein
MVRETFTKGPYQVFEVGGTNVSVLSLGDGRLVLVPISRWDQILTICCWISVHALPLLAIRGCLHSTDELTSPWRFALDTASEASPFSSSPHLSTKSKLDDEKTPRQCFSAEAALLCHFPILVSSKHIVSKSSLETRRSLRALRVVYSPG